MPKGVGQGVESFDGSLQLLRSLPGSEVLEHGLLVFGLDAKLANLATEISSCLLHGNGGIGRRSRIPHGSHDLIEKVLSVE